MSYNFILLKKTKHEHDKWRRLLVITVTFLFFCASVILVLADNIFDIFDKDRKNSSVKSVLEQQVKTYPHLNEMNFNVSNTCKLQSDNPCSIWCQNIFATDIVNESSYIKCDAEVFLFLFEVNFQNGTIKKGWLNEFSNEILQLKIDSIGVSYLSEGSFTGQPFGRLEMLTLINTKIAYLERNTFLGNTIKFFEFRFNTAQKMNFEYDALQHIASTLETLQLNKCVIEPQALKNLTGTNTTLILVTLDLRFNQINGIFNNTFTGAPSLTQLFLSDSVIEYIEEEAFSEIGSALQSMYINNNNLKTLPKGSFNGFQNTGLIKFDNNPWQCDCDLYWLKVFYEKNIQVYFANGESLFLCNTEDGYKNYSEVDFCPSYSTTISISSESPSTSRSSTSTQVSTISSRTTKAITIDPFNYVTLFCEDCLKKIPFKKHHSRTFSHSVTVRNGTITYDFYRIGTTPFYEINIRDPVDDEYLIWFNIDNHNDTGCMFNIQNTVDLKNLSYSKFYLICLLKQNEDTVSPFDCTSIRVPPTWENTPWIFNKNKLLLIILCVIILIIVIVITAIVVYYMIKKYPKLVNASKENLKSENHLPYVYPPSWYSNSDGYLTPKLYERIISRSRRNLSLSTISERDFEGAFNIVYEVNEPPPLPPNHPTKWRKFDDNGICKPSEYENLKSQNIHEDENSMKSLKI